LSGSTITLSGGAGVFGDLAAVELPLPDGGGEVWEESLDLTLPERFEGVAGDESPCFRKF
jgi:hypothetical protein